MFAYANVGKFHFTSSEARYFTMCDSTLFHILREQNISLSAFVSTNAMLAKERTENLKILCPFPFVLDFTALSQINLLGDFVFK